ncbi:hypothetical protein ACJRO7_000358 [Eucalyptus globulus]|uniref:Uncharacterized protein n=1 Tax=Eucalyptus globulus TaxID=34317 RepID=A0ABD3LSP1_EUCGL
MQGAAATRVLGATAGTTASGDGDNGDTAQGTNSSAQGWRQEIGSRGGEVSSSEPSTAGLVAGRRGRRRTREPRWDSSRRCERQWADRDDDQSTKLGRPRLRRWIADSSDLGLP